VRKDILEHNSFKLIVLANLVGDFEQYYADCPSRGRWQYAQQRETLQRLEAAMKASVVEKGADLLHFYHIISTVDPTRVIMLEESAIDSSNMPLLQLFLPLFMSSCSDLSQGKQAWLQSDPQVKLLCALFLVGVND